MSSEEIIREASDPATAPARLAELASADRATWPALAGNPSTYDGLLNWLGERNDPAVNAVLTARAQAALPPIPPPAPTPPPAPAPAPAPVEAAQPLAAAPDETPTVVSPAAPAFAAPAQPETEHTAVFASPTAEPTAVFQAPGSPEPTAAYAAAPAATEPPSDPANGGKNLAIVIAMVLVVIALIAGAAWGATEVFGDDDDVQSSSPVDTKKTNDAPDDDDDDDLDLDLPTIAPPSIDSPEADLPTASAEFCSSMETVQTVSEELVDRGTTTPDLDDIKEMGEDMGKAYDDLAAAAPAELRADIDAMGGYFDLMTNPTADSAGEMSDSFSDYMDSAQKVSTYYAQNCL